MWNTPVFKMKELYSLCSNVQMFTVWSIKKMCNVQDQKDERSCNALSQGWRLYIEGLMSSIFLKNNV